MHPQQNGFTIVEIIIVIVVIGILAGIGLLTFRGSPERADFTRALADMKHINDAIAVYKAQKGSYPLSTATNCDITALNSSLVPVYLDTVPFPSNRTASSYKYCTDATGSEYKLIRTIPAGLPKAEKDGVSTGSGSTTTPALNTTGPDANTSWGYWTAGGASL